MGRWRWSTPDRRAPRGLSTALRLSLLIAVSGLLLILALYKITNILSRGFLPDRFKPNRSVHLTEPATEENANPDVPLSGPAVAPLRVAIAPVVSPEKSMELYREFVSYLAARLSRAPVFLQKQNYAEVNDLVRYDFADLALVCTYAFIRGEREFGMEVLVIPEIHGATTYQSYIIVAEASRADSLEALEGKTFASSDLMSSSGWLYPATWLIEHHKDPKTFFSRHVITGSHDRSIVAVASGVADAAAVDSLVYDQMGTEDPTLTAATRIVQKSPLFGTPPLVVGPRIDPALKQALYRVLVTMHKDETGRAVLRRIGIDRFVKPDARIYDEVRRMAGLWESYR